MALDTPGITQ